MKTSKSNTNSVLNKDDLLPHLSYFDIEDIHSNYSEEEAAHEVHNNKFEVRDEISRNFNEEDFI